MSTKDDGFHVGLDDAGSVVRLLICQVRSWGIIFADSPLDCRLIAGFVLLCWVSCDACRL